MAWLLAPPADIHQGALLHKDLAKNTQPLRQGRHTRRVGEKLGIPGKGQGTGGAGGAETMVLSDSYPARLQQLLLASDAVLDGDQTQHVFLKHTHTEP